MEPENKQNFTENKGFEVNFEKSIVVVVAVEDYDMGLNDHFENEGGKSYPRDLNCAFCKRELVMSNDVFKVYENCAKKPPVVCSKCLMKKLTLGEDLTIPN